jgi:hypothetical protein
MALQMYQPLACHIAELGILGLAEGIVSRPDPVDGIEARAIAQVNGGAVIPVHPVHRHPGA